ncbi:hypothetical protein [Marinoscillum furvescens]|uniref:Uncharacterized protein n=1 Tax=Marinoscillum furvescens DSM 4134 TaxID=1122208 RepID=A0A3D9L7J4_MARFU|nr:hypothetical protein C7460_1039 [Marinoscillum furvescens DSM 4134]
MLEYFKTILSKVSFDRWLFEKELKKAINSLVPDEILNLRDWCYEKFSHMYESILDKCFPQALV